MSATYDVSSSPYHRISHAAAEHDLSHTYSERSIDDAIYERIRDVASPTSPIHFMQDGMKQVAYFTEERGRRRGWGNVQGVNNNKF